MIEVLMLIVCIVIGALIILIVANTPMSKLKVEKNLPKIGDLDTVRKESKIESKKDEIGSYLYALIAMAAIIILYGVYQAIVGTPYEGHFKEWLNLLVRLAHITFGIAWIGASFYFVFLENSLNRTKDVREELAGNLWAVHGGGFYYVEKYKLAPKAIPKNIHWFKYEAYFTWLSGMSLLFVVYYFNANSLLIDPNVLDISSALAISIGLSSFVIGWLVYALLSASRLANNTTIFAFVGLIILATFAWGYCQVFSARAAFIHFGGLLGTLMVGNVFFVIIPAQKEMVRCAKEKKELHPSLGANAGWRSYHNNYFTLPVLFIMISNHFPSTFGAENNWVILMAITIGTAGIKHYLNLKEKNESSILVLPVSILILLIAAFVTGPKVNNEECNDVSFTQIYSIIQERCVSCHSAQPTDNIWTAAPNGVMYDSAQQIVDKSELIMQRVVATKNMPLNNKTNITPEERNLIRCWILQGSKTTD